MKLPWFIILTAPFLFGSCDHIDAIGDKVNELKDDGKESTQAEAGMDLTGGIVKTGPTIQDLEETEFDTFIAEPGRLNIVDFHADWCPPCKKLAPILTEVVETNAHVVRLGKINVDHAKELAREQGVSSIPDVRFYVDGKLVHKFTGAPPKAQLEELIAVHTATIKPAQALSVALANEGGDGAAVAPPTRPANAKPIEVGSPRRQGHIAPTRPANAKPIEEAMKPMEKNWLPPGVNRKE